MLKLKNIYIIYYLFTQKNYNASVDNAGKNDTIIIYIYIG